MPKATKHIASFEDVYKWIANFADDDNVIFRGQACCGWPLTPKIGRQEYSRDFEEDILDRFRARAYALIDVRGRESEWEFLTLAQHHGLPTRLLDWTRNPLVALYFSVEAEHAGDSDFVAYKCMRRVKRPIAQSPYEWSQVARYDPLYTSKRIAGQTGLFTIHPHPDRPIEHDQDERTRIWRARVQAKCRPELKAVLARYGIHRASLFPDLDGVAQHAWYDARHQNRRDRVAQKQ